MKMKFSFLLLCFALGANLFAQKSIPSGLKENSQIKTNTSSDEKQNEFVLEWQGVKEYRAIDERKIDQVFFKGARIRAKTRLPYFAWTIEVSQSTESIKASLKNAKSEYVSESERGLLQGVSLPKDFRVSSIVRSSAGKKYAVIMVEPLKKTNSRVEKLLGFDLELTEQGSSSSASRGARGGNSWVDNSVLNSGQWYKLATGEDGIYRVTFKDLQSYGFSMVDVNSDQIKLFGTGAGMLPFSNDQERPDDLIQIPIDVFDGGDGAFDSGDYFLFYGEDQITWKNTNGSFVHETNPFSDSAYYFLSVNEGAEAPKRIKTESVSVSSTRTSEFYDYLDLYEEENINLIKSGRRWYGLEFGSVTSKDFGFNVPNIQRTFPVQLNARYAARSIGIAGVSVSLSLPS